MKQDLSSYQLTTDYSWLPVEINRIGREAVLHLFDEVYALLDRLKPGETFSLLRSRPENLSLVVKACCSYVDTHKNYYFTDWKFNRITHEMDRKTIKCSDGEPSEEEL